MGRGEKMKYITRFADGSSVLCERCGEHPPGVWIFGKHWVCDRCLRPEDMLWYGKDDDQRLIDWLEQKHKYTN